MFNYKYIDTIQGRVEASKVMIICASPELEGETIETSFSRWIPGLGLTETNIFPHYQLLKDDYLDGLRVMEDITYADSYTHEILAMNDGSYITIENGREKVRGHPPCNTVLLFVSIVCL